MLFFFLQRFVVFSVSALFDSDKREAGKEGNPVCLPASLLDVDWSSSAFTCPDRLRRVPEVSPDSAGPSGVEFCSDRFPAHLVQVGPLTTVYLIWGGFDSMTDAAEAQRSLRSIL